MRIRKERKRLNGNFDQGVCIHAWIMHCTTYMYQLYTYSAARKENKELSRQMGQRLNTGSERKGETEFYEKSFGADIGRRKIFEA